MMEQFRELLRYRQLLYMITYRDIVIRYKQSVMGFLWAILMPIMIILAGVIVRYGYAMAAGVPLKVDDVASVAVKSLPWAFIVSSIRFSCNSLIANKDLVTKIYFPKEVLPLAASAACLFDFLVASAALAVVLLLMQTGWSVHLAWLPLLVLTMFVLASGVGMLVAAAGLFFRDVKYIVEILLTFGIFFTPVFYDIRMFGEKGKWLLLNPFAPILEAMRGCIVDHQPPDPLWLGYSVTVGIAALLGGYVFFKRLEPAFAESI